jgi:tRNA A-37 threonylcarbamoyl transferase component Bud32
MQLNKSLQNILDNFDNSGKLFIAGNRNVIKLFDYEGITINVKAFKVPNLFNRIIYKYFRKSKAKRSFDYATLLLEREIGTPKPIAYFEQKSFLGLEKSFYISQHLEFDLMFRDLVENNTYPDRENILKQFMAFCYKLHQNGIEFLDHSPGNTLIKKENEREYSFYLVDLNRMVFHKEMTFEQRMKNLSRLTPYQDMIEIMSKEYAHLSGEEEDLVFDTLWKYTSEFQYKFYRKKRIKNKLRWFR